MSKKSASKLFPEETKPMKEEDMNLPESLPEKEKTVSESVEESKPEESKEVEAPAFSPVLPSEEIVDVDFKEIKRQRFRFNGDNNKVLELNTRDLGISYRLKTAYDKLNALMDEVAKVLSDVPDDEDAELSEDRENEIVDALKKLDDSMREQLDYLFDAPVSKVLGSDGSMYTPIGGIFLYERIIDKLTALYEKDLNTEFFNLKQRVEGRAERYTKVKKATKKYHI